MAGRAGRSDPWPLDLADTDDTRMFADHIRGRSEGEAAYQRAANHLNTMSASDPLGRWPYGNPTQT